MESDEYESPPETIDEVKAAQTPYLCKVCGDKDAFRYLGAVCCPSCKMFFRRNADFDLNTIQCSFDGNCDITINSRRACRYCRLKKCFDVGMQKDLIRGARGQPSEEKKRKKQKSSCDVPPNGTTPSLPAVIPTLDLLNNDRSVLTLVQWTLLSNVTHTYDDKSPASSIRNAMELQLTYPSKMRLKMAMDYFKHIARSLYLSAGPFIKTMPEFISMSIDDQSILVERNIRSMSGFSGILIMRESNICHNPYYHTAFIDFYGQRRTLQAIRIVDHADNDGTLIKLMIPILALSTCSDILDPTKDGNRRDTTKPGGTRFFSNTLLLLKGQNTYAEMMFKYMLHRYGYTEAALRFASLIKSSIDQNLMVSGDGDLKQHDQMVQTITDQTERSLKIHDEEME